MYGLDIVHRLEAAGLSVEVVDVLQHFTPRQITRHALRGDDRYVPRVSPAKPSR